MVLWINDATLPQARHIALGSRAYRACCMNQNTSLEIGIFLVSPREVMVHQQEGAKEGL